jgi:hypothetical protein
VNAALLSASWRVVAQPPVLVPVGVALLLTLAVAPQLDAGHADHLRLGIATLLACALAATAEDPAAEVTAAAPRARWARCGGRLLLGFAVAAPVAVTAWLLIAAQAPAAATSGLAVQGLALLLIGPAVGFGMWAWSDAARPTYAAIVGVLCVSFALWLLPTTWSVIDVQQWGPPWEAALIRWSALVLLTCAVVATAWRDPLTRR